MAPSVGRLAIDGPMAIAGLTQKTSPGGLPNPTRSTNRGSAVLFVSLPRCLLFLFASSSLGCGDPNDGARGETESQAGWFEIITQRHGWLPLDACAVAGTVELPPRRGEMPTEEMFIADGRDGAEVSCTMRETDGVLTLTGALARAGVSFAVTFEMETKRGWGPVDVEWSLADGSLLVGKNDELCSVTLLELDGGDPFGIVNCGEVETSRGGVLDACRADGYFQFLNCPSEGLSGHRERRGVSDMPLRAPDNRASCANRSLPPSWGA